MNASLSRLRALVLLAGLSTPALGQPLFELVPFAPGYSSTRGLAISGDGQMVVGSAQSATTGSWSVWWWRGVGMATEAPQSSSIGVGTWLGTSYDGSVIVWPRAGGQASTRYYPATNLYEMIPVVGTVLPSFGCVSADGTMFGGSLIIPHNVFAGAWSQATGTLTIPTFSGMNQGAVMAASANGAILVGYASDWTNGTGQAFQWTVGSTPIGLGPIEPGHVSSHAFGVSADGSVIVGSTSNPNRPFRWTMQGGMIDIGPSSQSAEASAVSADGSVVAGQSTTEKPEAFVWDAQRGPRDLRGILLSQGVSGGLENLTLTTARSISADGVTIVGTATDPAGITYAYVARLGNAVCYVNCDVSSAPPVLNANDFMCFLNRFAAGDSYANCDGSTVNPVLNANDFECFLTRFANGC